MNSQHVATGQRSPRFLARPGVRQAAAMWLAGMPGVVIIALLVLPILAGSRPLPFPLPVLTLITLAQSTAFLALAVWAGVALAPKVGLRAPAFEAFATRSPVIAALRPQWLPGLIGGLAVGVCLVALSAFTPQALIAAAPDVPMPLPARLLYGGVTEELLLRWGFMTLLLWSLWRIFQRATPVPSVPLVWVAIIGSAALFGIAHLPAAASLVGELSLPVIVYVVAGNMAFGVLGGLLYWRVGLESAVIAHGVVHLVIVAASHL